MKSGDLARPVFVHESGPGGFDLTEGVIVSFDVTSTRKKTFVTLTVVQNGRAGTVVVPWARLAEALPPYLDREARCAQCGQPVEPWLVATPDESRCLECAPEQDEEE